MRTSHFLQRIYYVIPLLQLINDVNHLWEKMKNEGEKEGEKAKKKEKDEEKDQQEKIGENLKDQNTSEKILQFQHKKRKKKSKEKIIIKKRTFVSNHSHVR